MGSDYDSPRPGVLSSLAGRHPRRAGRFVQPIPHTLTAVAALFLWVPVSIVAFSVMKPHKAVAVLMVAAAILLPERQTIEVKLLPDIDKKTIACAWVLVPAMLRASRAMRKPNLGRLPWVMFGVMFFTDVMRAIRNTDAVVMNDFYIDGIKPHTAITFILEHVLVIVTPYYLGATLFRDRDKVIDLLKVFCVGGLAMIPFVLIELRLSPQMHVWVYGYMQHDWLQLVREGGYRPMVFMEHGLALTLFLTTATLCLVGLQHQKVRIFGVPAIFPAILLAVLVRFCHSLGAFIFLAALFPLLWWFSPKWQVRAALGMVSLVMLYPLFRASDTLPLKELVDWIASHSQDRAQSLDFRLTNESLVLNRVLAHRPLFGWGGFDRIFVYDRETGQNVIDGAWVIAYAESGLVGFLSRFGLLFWPVWVAWRRLKKVRDRKDKLLLGTLAAVAAMNIADLLPNGLFTYFPYLLAGVLLGAARTLSRPQPAFAAAQQAVARPSRPARRAEAWG